MSIPDVDCQKSPCNLNPLLFILCQKQFRHPLLVSLTSWVLIMLWLKVKSNTDWTNIYNCISPDRRTLRKMLFLSRLHVKNECFLCWTNHQSHLGTILSGKRNKFKELSNYSVSRISPLYSFDLYVKPFLPWDIGADILNFCKRNKIP